MTNLRVHHRSTRSNLSSRAYASRAGAAVILALAAGLLGFPPGIAADPGAPVAEDSRWLPWIGCWESLDDGGEYEEAGGLLVCFRFLEEGATVEIQTLSEGEVIAREEVRADGTVFPMSEGGCEGERWARWSADGHRLYLRSEMACAEGVTRSTQGVLAIQDGGQRWLEVHAVVAGGTDPVLGVRSFRPASSAVVEAAGIHPPEEGRRLAISTARASASGPLTPEEVAEAWQTIGTEATQALIVEAGHGYELDAATLRTLKATGVSEGVIDVMIGLSYPERFAIRGGTQDAEVIDESRTAARTSDRGTRRYRGYSAWGGYGYGYSSWGYRYDRFNPYGYGYGWGGGYWGTPVVIVNPPTVEDRRARVIPGRGYVAPGSTARDARQGGAAPSTTATPTRAPSASSTSASPPPSSPPPVRRAIPRPPPDPDPDPDGFEGRRL